MMNPNEIHPHRTDVDQAVSVIARHSRLRPRLAMILGSGLGAVADQIQVEASIHYSDLPHFGRSLAAGHRGQLILGFLEEHPIVAMAGRFHFYEGWSMNQIVFPIAVLAALGAQELIVSNAAGGIRPGLKVGDLVLIRDSIQWMQGFAGLGRSGIDSAFQELPSFRGDMFDANWRDQIMAIARENEVPVHQGCYLASSGPTYETRAEYRMLRRLGVDVVGMSTVPEAWMGRRLGMKVLGISMVSNVADPDRPQVTNHSEVIDAGRVGSARIEVLIRKWLQCLSSS
jgi:purine-nucleoside phosphorylase